MYPCRFHSSDSSLSKQLQEDRYHYQLQVVYWRERGGEGRERNRRGKEYFRHKQAQYAGRASIQLMTMEYFKGKEEEADGYIAGIRHNGVQVREREREILYTWMNKSCLSPLFRLVSGCRIEELIPSLN